MSNAKELNEDNFEEFTSQGNVVVDFFADWCGPCKMMGPVIDSLSEEMKDVKFAKVNVDTAGELAQRFQVRGIPTFIFFKDGEQVNRISGAAPKDEFQEIIESSF